MVWKNIKVDADQTLTKENVLTAELIKPEPLFIRQTDILTKYGNVLTENGIVIIAIVNFTPLQNNRNERMQIDSSIKENILEFNKYEKYEQVDAHGVLITYSMVHVDIHNFIMLANIMILIHWLTLLNYALVVTPKKPIRLHSKRENGIQLRNSYSRVVDM